MSVFDKKKTHLLHLGKRQTPFNLRVVLLMWRVSEYVNTGIVRRITGVLGHNEACSIANMVKLPSVPLHEEV